MDKKGYYDIIIMEENMNIRSKNSIGFTLIELIIIISIIVILAAVAVPIYINVVRKSKAEADIASVVILNQSSVAYAMTNEIQIPDIFQGIEDDPARIQKLVNEGFLLNLVVPQQDDAEFDWVVADQVWVINGGMNLGGEATPPPDDGGLDLSDYPDWSLSTTYVSANNYVVYDGKLYYNLWWVDGNILPGTAQVWQQVSDSWVNFNIYNNGDTVEYEGNTYMARHWTSGQTPVDSDYGAWELIS